MIGLQHYKSSRFVALTLALGLTIAPRAWAGPPIDASDEADQQDQRFAAAPEPESEAELEPEASEPLRIVDSEASEPALEPETSEPVEIDPPAPTLDDPPPGPPMVDAKRPKPGVGMVTLGALSMAASSALVITALAGPGWLDVERDEAMIAAGLSLPFALAGLGLVVGGSKANKRYRSWASRNHLSPPESGNGLLVGGASMTAVFIGAAAYGAQIAVTKPTHERGDWAPTIIAGGFSTIGITLLCVGTLKRSKFADWQRSGYVTPGTMAVKGGGGLAISGRF